MLTSLAPSSQWGFTQCEEGGNLPLASHTHDKNESCWWQGWGFFWQVCHQHWPVIRLAHHHLKKTIWSTARVSRDEISHERNFYRVNFLFEIPSPVTQTVFGSVTNVGWKIPLKSDIKSFEKNTKKCIKIFQMLQFVRWHS